MHRFFTQPQLPWILLWIGLTFLILLLGVMIRTSWGQSHPLRKCAGLSLLAHLLLACYATTVEIVTATGGSSHGAMNLTLVEGSAEGTDDPNAVAIDDPASQAPSAGIEQNPAAPPLLDGATAVAHQSHLPPPLLETAKDEPKSEPPENPEPEKTVSKSAPEQPQNTDPPTTNVATTQPADHSTQPLPPAEATSTVPQIPEPPQTQDDSQWVSGDPAGATHLTEPTPEGPLASATASNSQPKDNSTNPAHTSVVATPVAARAAPEIYADRFSPDRAEIVRRRGGSAESESAVQAALAWLAANQSSDGRWDASRFGAGREMVVLGQDRQGAGAKADTAMTGLALLAFLGAGNTHEHGAYSKTVQRGLEFLIAEQAADGNLAGRAETYAFMYSHGIATFAMTEAYALTGDKRLEGPVKAAIRYTLAGQIRATGGWRYRQIETPGEQGDTSQLGWQLMALKSAELAGIDVPASARDGAARYLRSVASGQYGGKASYRPGEKTTATMTAEALVCRQFLGMARENPAGNEAGDYLLLKLPGPEQINLYYWYYGTLGMYQLQGDHWQRWNEALQNTLVRRQRVDGDMAGSWDPDCIWAGYGGRVYSTAMSALCLEVYYRYLPIYRSTSQHIATRPNP
jgi:hypothetical protein